MNTSTSGQRRVVITGVGVICPLGSSTTALWSALAERRSGVVECEILPLRETNLPLRYAGEARQFEGKIDDFGQLESTQKKMIRKGLKLMCRETQMALAAATLAINDSGLAPEDRDPERSGIVMGSDYMLTLPDDYINGVKRCTTEAGEFDFTDWGRDGLSEMTPLWMLKYLPNMPASHIAILNDLRGPNNSLTLREAASNMAVGEAFRTIGRGHADLMLAGATGTRLMPLQAVHAMQTEQLATTQCLPESACRPFDKNRLGMVAGEGAGMVVLEERSSALARGARIYGELLGQGSSSVADRDLNGDCRQAIANAVAAALTDAGLAPGDLGHVNAHGLATSRCDIDEAAGLRAALGTATDSVPVTALKSYFGNLGAGSGMVELVGSLLALEQGKLPATLNYQTPDPECPLAIAADEAVPGSSFLTINVTHQGQAAALVVAAG